MTIEMSRFVSHLIVSSIFIMVLGLVGTMIVSLARVMLSLVRPTTAATSPKLPTYSGSSHRRKKPMAIPSNNIGWDATPTMSRTEQEIVDIPTFLRKPLNRQHQLPAIINASQQTASEPQATVTRPPKRQTVTLVSRATEHRQQAAVSQPLKKAQESESDDLFAKKDIFVLNPETT